MRNIVAFGVDNTIMILNYKKYFYTLSLVLVVISIVGLFVFPLRLGTDFAGGSLLEVSFSERITHDEIRINLQEIDLGDITIRNVGETSVALRFHEVDEDTHQQILSALPGAEELRFNSVGPTIGKETQRRSIVAAFLVVVMILLYVAWAFRKISYPLGSFRYGLVALVALFHDVFITIGIFSVLGYMFGVEIGVPFVAAILTILGYSVNDTIVIFDRIRENLLMRATGGRSFKDVVEVSIRQTIVRSLATSITTLLVLTTVFISFVHTNLTSNQITSKLFLEEKQFDILYSH